MSVERSFEAWEEVQRQGLDLADRLTQGFTGLLQINPKIPFDHLEFPTSLSPKSWDHLSSAVTDVSGITGGVSAVLDIGNRLGQASAEFGASFSGLAQQVFRHLPVPFLREGNGAVVDEGVIGENFLSRRRDEVVEWTGDKVEGAGEVFGDRGFLGSVAGLEELSEDDGVDFDLKGSGSFGRSQGSISITSTYDSRNHDVESSLVARGDLWRAEASHGTSVAGNDQSSLYLLQLGPVLFVRDTTLLLPVHLSKQHLLWYGYDRKNGVHSLCPAIWSKHRRWLSMSMISLNPLSCSFLDLQFPNGQLTYIAGEGLTTSSFLPILGGLLQLQGQYPGESRFSFSCKNKWGTRITPAVQWPDKSFTLGIAQALAWQRSGLMLKPTFQLSISPTFGGSNPGIRAELIHTLIEQVSIICGCACTVHPSAYASVSIGRSKWNGNVGTSGIVVRAETPLGSVGRPSFSVQVNSGIEF